MRRFRLLLPLVLLAAGLVVSCGTSSNSGASSGPTEPKTEGQVLYETWCQSCHGSEGQGGVGPKLADGEVVKEYPNAVDEIKFVSDGNGGMPAFGDKLTEAELTKVVEYTRTGLGD